MFFVRQKRGAIMTERRGMQGNERDQRTHRQGGKTGQHRDN